MTRMRRSGRFLSCLGGSEQDARPHVCAPHFLSCLGGSELMVAAYPGGCGFLSCLGGSEQEYIKINVLIVKELSPKKAALPFQEQYR